MNHEKINPCMRCGNKNCHVVHFQQKEYLRPDINCYFVECGKCGRSSRAAHVDEDPKTPYCLRRNPEEARKHAIDLWNTRNYMYRNEVISDNTTIISDIFSGGAHDDECDARCQ